MSATDLTAEQIGDLAQLYVEKKPLATLIGLGTGYWKNSGATVRLIDALAAISGNIGVSGGGAGTNMTGARGLDLTAGSKVPSVESRRVLLPRLGEEHSGHRGPAAKDGLDCGR